MSDTIATSRTLRPVAPGWIELSESILPHLFPFCRLRILLVTDGSLDFSTADFGLSCLIEALAATPLGPHAAVSVTVGHRSGFVSDAQVAVGNPHVARGVKGFRFDDPGHFAPGLYDQAWLLGFSTASGAGDSTAGWSGQPTEAELRALADFMSGTGAFAGREPGGVFATGDHGGLGSALCGFVPRVRTMRRWFATTGPFGNPGAPGMTDPQRNDTNRLGDPGSQFDDQSDDLPQPIQPRWYYRPSFLPWRKVRFPHPLLCTPKGTITVLPDHPHEGKCRMPYETDRTLTYAGAAFEEWPAALAAPGAGRVMPEVIATSTVLAGATAGFKQPTEAQSFGAIAAYDGDPAGLGRVVTDATWHHKVNINLVGELGNPDPVKAAGFEASAAGQAALARITAYYRNIARWLAPPAKRACMRRGALWYAAWSGLLVEAVGDGRMLQVERAPVTALLELGRLSGLHLGKLFGPCETLVWTLPFLKVPELVRLLDPWPPVLGPRPQPGPDPVPWFDPEPMLHLALGGAMAALREAFPTPDPRLRERAEASLDEVMERGARIALARGAASMDATAKRLEGFGRTLAASPAAGDGTRR